MGKHYLPAFLDIYGMKPVIEKISGRSATTTKITREYLQRIEDLNDDLGAYTTVTSDLALERQTQLSDKPMSQTPTTRTHYMVFLLL